MTCPICDAFGPPCGCSAPGCRLCGTGEGLCTKHGIERRTLGLRWEHGRWHLAGKPIHAGTALELRSMTSSGSTRWISVHIESREAGRKLDAYVDVDGTDFKREIDPDFDALRWPEGKR